MDLPLDFSYFFSSNIEKRTFAQTFDMINSYFHDPRLIGPD